MGESSRRRETAASQLAIVRAAADKAGAAISKLAKAASATHGFDCMVHAELGRRLLAELGLEATLVVGNAAWRVGPGPDDIIGHMYQIKGYAPAAGPAFPFHAWLRVGDILVDFTTYLLQHKASELDALDGGSTTVVWCPASLVVPVTDVVSFEQAVQSPVPGAFHYQHIPQMQAVITRGLEMDEQDVQAAILILRNPDVVVVGPNDVRAT